MRQETWDEFNARRAANRVNRIADAETDDQRRERIATHIEAQMTDAFIAIWNRQTAKKLGMI